MKHILVCGGAGYIGAHMVKRLAESGYRVTVLDNFSTGHREAVRWGELVEGDLLDCASLREAFTGRNYDAVMHFCALSLVGESVQNPLSYYHNNIGGTLNLLAAMRDSGVTRLVFSSTAAVYGTPEHSPINEIAPVNPINPYGRSKATVERILEDIASMRGIHSVSLRYFNAAGADPAGEIGESHSPETHLIPNLMKAALNDSDVDIFGDDYATRDGTCIRDYVHVNDLAQAHLLAVDYLQERTGAYRFNLGSDSGHSVLEVIESARRVTGKPIVARKALRRAGDPPSLVASSALARRELGWQPEYENLDTIVETAWRWHRAARY